MAITSSSSYDDVKDAYLDNLSYETDGSTTKALAFVEACRALILFVPSRNVQGGRGGHETEFDIAEIRRQLETARAYVAANSTAVGTAGSMIGVDFRNFRDE